MKKFLIILTLMLMSVSSVYAGAGFALKHANPMPNLMRIAMGNADLLNLSKEQRAELKAWGSENKPKMMKMVQTVIHEEKMLKEEALTRDKDVMKQAELMLDTRRKIIQMKTACRAHMKKVLSEKQYAQVIGIYRSTR